MNSSILSIKKRDGKIAPFIKGMNVCDLGPKEWTFDVQRAILHAYELGKLHASQEASKIDCYFEFTSRFPDEE